MCRELGGGIVEAVVPGWVDYQDLSLGVIHGGRVVMNNLRPTREW